MATSWTENKGLSHFVSLAKELPDIKVILVGKAETDIPEIDNFKCVGRTANVDELAEYYSLADTLLVCSPQETFGKVSAEALACGTPVIQTTVPQTQRWQERNVASSHTIMTIKRFLQQSTRFED